MIRFALIIFPLIFIVISTAQSQESDEGWTIIQNCATSGDPITDYGGTIFTYEPEVGIRGLRADMPSSYFVAFDGTNFTGAAAVSPDGELIAIPSGLISFSTLVDETYQVNEIRVQSTDPATTSITNRIGWQANYRGTQPDLVMRDIRWLDENTLLYAQDTWQNEIGQNAIFFVNAATDETTEWENSVVREVLNGLSPDRSRAFGLYQFGISLIDVESGEMLLDATQPRSHLLGWSPDSSQFALQSSQRVDNEIIPMLSLVNRDGENATLISTLDAAQLRWSPDGTQFAFSAYNEDTRNHRLLIGDVNAQIITDHCMDVRYGNETTGYGLQWSPDGTQLAILSDETTLPLHILDLNSNQRRQIENYNDTRYSFLIAWAG